MQGKPEMAFVREGPYQMGSTSEQLKYAMRLCLSRKQDCRPSWWRTEQPAHWVVVPGFWIDRTEVTQAAYEKCVEGGKCGQIKQAKCRIWDPSSRQWITGPVVPKRLLGPKKPVVCVNWAEAGNYCSWAGKRLPTEAEWERAARGTDGRLYPWGNDPFDGRRGNGCDKECGEIAGKGWRVEHNINDGVRFLSDVGSYPAGASPAGILDAAGSVWEWVQDWYGEDYYSASERRAPAGPQTGEFRVVRGGSWSNESDSLRSGFRYSLTADTRITTLGFRCAYP